jgi:hypothetical protein
VWRRPPGGLRRSFPVSMCSCLALALVTRLLEKSADTCAFADSLRRQTIGPFASP